jgi:hypothetical protein
MVSTFIQPLDLYNILVNFFLGSADLFVFVFVIAFSFISAKYNLPNKIYLTLMAIGLIMFSVISQKTVGQSIYVLIIFLVGVVTFKGVSRIMQ